MISHVGLWDNLTWEVTKLGEKFIERIDQGADPMKEMIMLMLVPGKWYELILDIKKGQAIINHSGSVEYKDKLKEVFISNGSIGLNPERKSSGGRKFLQSAQQILGRFRLLKKHGRTYYKSSLGWEFDEGLIDQYITDYYRYYIEQDVAA